MEEQRPWHRLFGLSWTDFFRGLPVTVEMEKDLSLKKQLLDILLIRNNIKYFDGFIRLVVINQLPPVEQNAMLQVYSTKAELLSYGVEHYRYRSTETSSLLNELLRRYLKEAQTMPDALEELTRQTIDRILKEIPTKKRLEGLSLEQRLEGLSPEERKELLRLLTVTQDPSKAG